LPRFVRIKGDYSLPSLAFRLSLSLGFWCYSVNEKSIDGLVKRSIVGGDSIVKESIGGLFFFKKNCKIIATIVVVKATIVGIVVILRL
jgi:uncharacterized membrane protein SpoIIM required for sporulation